MVSVAVAGPVLARSDEESERLVPSVAALAAHGLPVYLADGGSPEPFVARLREIEGVTVEPTRDRSRKLVSQVQQALATAVERSDAEHVLYTEPDKGWFFSNRLSDFLVTPHAFATEPGIAVPMRDAASFATFPGVQRLPESLFNRLAAETLGLPPDADVLYGPLLIHRDLVPYVARIEEACGWGWRTFLFAVCRRLGLPLHTWAADLPCPDDQRGEDDEAARLYRIAQMAQNVRGLELGLRVAVG